MLNRFHHLIAPPPDVHGRSWLRGKTARPCRSQSDASRLRAACPRSHARRVKYEPDT